MSRHTKGEIGVLSRSVMPLCCRNEIPPGTRVAIIEHPTPNRFHLMLVDNGPDAILGIAKIPDWERMRPCHNVKASSVWFEGELPE